MNFTVFLSINQFDGEGGFSVCLWYFGPCSVRVDLFIRFSNSVLFKGLRKSA